VAVAWFSWTAAVCFLAIIGASPAAIAQQFPNPPMIVTSPDPQGLVTADFNNDGHQDLAYVTTGQAPTLHVLLGNGKGGFTEGTTVALPAGACTFEVVTCRMTVGDFTHSGHPGILMPWSLQSSWGFLVLPGKGDGTFGSAIVSTVPPSDNPGLGTYVSVQSAVADFNGDGNLDIAAPDLDDGQIRIYLGDGKGNFTAGASFNDSNRPYAVYASDVNHDGHIDLMVLAQYISGAEIWLGDGKGNFTFSNFYPVLTVTTFFRALTVADVNGDGNVDIVGTDGSGDVQVATGNPDGTFNALQTIASGIEGAFTLQGGLYAADLTGSGIPALIVGSVEGFDTAVPSAKLTYGAVQKRTSGPFATQVVFADFNEDGAPDMAVGVAGGIQFFLGNHSGLFPDSTITPLANPATFLFAGDFNGDGIADVASIGSDGYIRTYAESKNGSLGSPVKSSTAVTTSFDYFGNTVGDFDGDGHQDIAMLGQVFYGNGDGTFTPVSLTTFSAGVGAAFVTDLNKDGKSDLISILGPTSAPGANAYYYSLVALLGTAQRTFNTVTTNFPAYTPGEGITTPAFIGVGDLNGDGYPDAAVYDPNVSALETWLGKGDGSFRPGSTVSLIGSLWTPEGTGGLLNSLGEGVIVDLDGDGNADLAFLATEAASDSNLLPVCVLVIEYGDGKGGFAATQVIPLSRSYNFMTATKLSSGALPSIFAGNSNLIGVLRNLGGRQFSNEDFYTAGTMTGLVVADFNGDGLGDLLPLRANGSYNPPGSSGGLTVLLNQAEAGGNGTGVANGALASTPATLNYNQGFTLTAMLTASTAGAPAPTGTVSFYLLGLPLGTAPINQGSATLQVPGSVTQSLTPGIVAIMANYTGDSYYAATDLTTIVQILNPVYATHTALSLSAGGISITSIQAAGFFTMTAAVTAPVPVAHGDIAFFDGGNVIGHAEIANGQASFSTNLLAIGSHSLSAQYLGYSPPNSQSGLAGFQPSTSLAVPLTVSAVGTSATLLPSSSTPTAGAVLTLTANLTSAAGAPIGGVTFFDGTNALGTLTLDSSGTVAFSTASLSVGQHSITAQYAANGIFAGSVTPPSTVTVAAASAGLATTTTQIVSIVPCTATGNEVSVQVTGAPNQTGSVSLVIDGQLAATAALSANGFATVPLALASTGTQTLVASFSGSSLAAPSASPQFETTAYDGGEDFTLQATQTHFAATADGALPPIPLTVTAVNGWNSRAVFRCVSGLPQGYSCSFAPSSVSGGGNTMLTIRKSSGTPLVAFLLVPGFWLLRKKWSRMGQWMIPLLVFAVLFLSSCSEPHPRASTFVVTVEGFDGALVHSAQVQVSIPNP
jgi:hypothetical protein